jgi:hypothetical protein
MRILIAVLLLSLSQVEAQSSSKPRIVPYFDVVDDGPAFFVECQNSKNDKVSSGAPEWPWNDDNIRMDRKPLTQQNGSMGPGLTTQVEPGQFWRGIIAFRQSTNNYYPAVRFEALVRSTRSVTLIPGKHTIAVQCQGVWSDDFDFYVERETKQ